MPLRVITSAALGCILLFAALAGCSQSHSDGVTCAEASDCVIQGTTCDTARGVCVCLADEACADGYFCNAAGVCQARAGCEYNGDCSDDSFCDGASGQCLASFSAAAEALCGVSTHCPFGTVCKSGRCEDGCFDDGDCVLGQICVEGQCFSGDGVCRDSSFCDFGELCGGDAYCASDVGAGRPYCRGCSARTLTNPAPCDDPRNFCLINSQETGGLATFCGVDCSSGQGCANGYGCHDVVILTDDVCASDAECQCPREAIAGSTRACLLEAACVPRIPGGGGAEDPDATACFVENHATCLAGRIEGEAATCVVPKGQLEGTCVCVHDDDCEAGATCVSGQCCGVVSKPGRSCTFGENRVSGYCTCMTDADCPRDVCDPTRGACLVTGRPCTPGNDDCGAIACIDGGCRIGQNCAPLQGLSCSVVGGDG
ncbi:MAG: hypothetical protein H6729_06810 [Deltaproteobacteria bacterium]|nr:hypothetical protein [Deltaproteobacteria bacterium]